MGLSLPFTFILYLILFSSSSTSLSVDRISQFESLADGKNLVSSGGSFEFGFFSPGNSKSRYAGIWYSKIPAPIIVIWVANRCNPINDSSSYSFTIDGSGNAVLLYGNKTVLWSTSLPRQAKKPILRLLDSGNLVLSSDERDGTVLWESFDHPSDTVLPGMKLGWDFKDGIERRVTSWKSRDDPCDGDSSYGFETNSNGSPEIYLRKGGSKVYRSGPWNGVRFNGLPDMTTSNAFYDYRYVFDDRELYFTYSIKFVGEFFARVVVNETTGMRERYVWVAQKQAWVRFDYAPKTGCDRYGFCGPNGVCAMVGQNPSCNCITRVFKARDPRNRTRGCVRKTEHSCVGSKGDGFVKIAGLKIPDTAHSRVNRSMNLKECRDKCLNNCSCTAYTNSDIRGQGIGCFMWFGDLVDTVQFRENGQDLYVRGSASELEGKVNMKHKAAIIAALVVAALALLLFGLWILKSKCLKEKIQEKDQEGLELPLFDLATVCSATDNFSNENKLGEGGFGPVYKGTLKDGREIAVKRLSKCSGQGLNEFKNEAILIAKLQHRNLVRLLGCCIEGEEMMLIYEYMPNKSLDFFIFDETKKKVLEWNKRFEIICGIARGILYLHQDSRLRIIHRDLKASNVLLDSEMTPKISDFGMAKSFGGNQTEGNTTRVVGTYGYMAPEYASDGLFSMKSDVFSFGILVLEMISGRKNRGFFNPDRDLNLTGHAWRLWQEENALAIVDEYLMNSSSMSQILRCVHISLLCVQQCPDDRPNMPSVVMMLGSQSSLDQPKEPGFFVVRAFDDHVDASSSSNQVPSINEVSISALQPR